MRRTLAIVLAICPLSAAAQDLQLCHHVATEAADQSVTKTSEKLALAIPPETSQPVVDEIAARVCGSVDQTKTDKIEEVASIVSSTYFENAVQLGKSTKVAALVDGAVDHTLGLGLDDLRRYGTLTVTCTAPAATVQVRGASISCGKRLLLDKGDLQIKVSAAVALCIANATLGERQELVCDCVAQAQTPAIPLPMACK